MFGNNHGDASIEDLKFEGATGAPPDFSAFEGVGESTAQNLRSEFDSPVELQDASLDDLTSVRGIGESRARTIKSRVGGDLHDRSPGGSVEAGGLMDAMDDTREAAAQIVQDAADSFEQVVELGEQVGDRRERRRDLDGTVPFAGADEETVRDVAQVADVFSTGTQDPYDPDAEPPNLPFDEQDRELAAEVKVAAWDVLQEQHGYDFEEAREVTSASPGDVDPGIVADLLNGNGNTDNGSSERTAPTLVDDRAQQDTLDVGESAARTARRDDRDSSVAGSGEFEDTRSIGSDPGGITSQTTLQPAEEQVGDGQIDLTGEAATVESGGEWQNGDGDGNGGEVEADIPNDVSNLERRAFLEGLDDVIEPGETELFEPSLRQIEVAGESGVVAGPSREDAIVVHESGGEVRTRGDYADENVVEFTSVVETEYGDKIALDSPYEAKEDIKSLDWEETHREWDPSRNAWLVDAEAAPSVADELRREGWSIAVPAMSNVTSRVADVTQVQLVDTENRYSSGEDRVFVEDETQNVAETAVRWAENRDVLGERVDDDLIDAVKTGELSEEDAAVVEAALREYAIDQQDRADAGEHSIMGGPDSAKDWAEWAREAADDIDVTGDDAELVRNVRELREAEREPIPATERDPSVDLMRRASSADVSLAPDEALGGVGTESIVGQTGPNWEAADAPPEDELDELAGRDMERIRREEAAEAAGSLDTGTGSDGGAPSVAEFTLTAEAAGAALQAARHAERRSEDLDRETLRAVRGNVADARDDGGTVLLTDEQADALSDAVADFGVELSPAQRPDGLDELEDIAFGIDTDDGTPSTGSETGTDTGPGPSREKIEFGGIDDAREFREQYGEVLHQDDVPQSKTVTVRADADDAVLDRGREDALISHADETEGTYGMERLTGSERDSLEKQHDTWDWQQYGFEAMRAKAALAAQGVTGSDWLDYYEPGEDWSSSLDKLDESKQSAARGGGQTAVEGMRHDSREEEMTRGDIARVIDKARGRQEQHAIEGAKEGYDEAIEALRDVHGWSEAEISKLRGLVESADTTYTRADVVEIEKFERSQTSGRMVPTPPNQARVPPGKRSPTTGRFVPPAEQREDPGIARNRETGKFVPEDRGSGGGR
ncbi:helix-hairpin-helix domain-containing protein [Natrarchaeobaculum sulfurireducens]|uniref:Helix-hairpin-helix DNA-binding motif class 1 domain-containing protein n=1 Tax=Natrarchaeobaculum sulfurireducens TaxID=2044521 RepID=A0A346PMG3_9EURY|nr:helix-hairpin-helix domain-containing protein [Natrarchaeobaculum sulfurireducens]AXR80708.1 hypothetical protein AArcMg_0686 [Natrarchaeobaculum sulfurireducens]